MDEKKYDVVVVGAGASGLMAAWEFAMVGKKVAVLEARERIGGRMFTYHDERFDMPVELGAEFIHGKLELTQTILDRAGIDYYEVTGEVWRKNNGKLKEQNDFIEDYSALKKKFREVKQDIPVAEFLDRHLEGDKFEKLRFTLKNYVEGYYAADTERASTLAMKDELGKSGDEQYRIEGGYENLFDFIFDQCRRKGVAFFMSTPVQKIRWAKDTVEIISGNESFSAEKLLITVPVGVLQNEKIQFTPALPQITEAARKLGYGPVIKTVLQFDEAFWKNRELVPQKNLKKLGFLFSHEVIPTWWTYFPKNVAMITGWSGGPHAKELQHLSDKEILGKAIQSLSNIFDIGETVLHKKLRGWHVANWQNDPYSCGGYSYEVVGGKDAKKKLGRPVEDTIYFSGEGLFEGTEIGTVNAALKMGQETAHTMIAAFKKQT
jgi:monoamine oxidase